MNATPIASDGYVWWRREAPYTRLEVLLDIVVHGLGICLALGIGGTLLVLAAFATAPQYTFAIATYVLAMVSVFVISLVFNTATAKPIKQLFARLDQAAIFLAIAGSYTPILAIIAGTSTGSITLSLVWGAALVGVALKLLVPERFGRLALVLYLGIGWSGVVVFKTLAESLPPSTLWLLLAGGVAYSSGIIFHVWEKLRFHNVLWHSFVVLGATLHLYAVLDCMVIRRL